MKTQLQIKKAAKGAASATVKGGKNLTSSGPGTVTLASISGSSDVKQVVLVDEYNPLRPNEYHAVKNRVKQQKEKEKSEDPEKKSSKESSDRKDRDRDGD